MNLLRIQADGDTTPDVTMDPNRGWIDIKGWSHPEDAIKFYTPILEWLKEYAAQPASSTEVHFRFQYYNTASAKQIFRVLSELENVAMKSKVHVHWHYETEDTDMLNSGERLARMCTLPFTYVADPS